MIGNLIGSNNPKIMLIDAAGALVSIILLSFLYIFQEYIGIPKQMIFNFICIAIFCFLYSSIVYLKKPRNWRFYLCVIALINIAYSLYTIYAVYGNIDSLTLLGHIYFIGEVLVIFALSFFELNYARSGKEAT